MAYRKHVTWFVCITANGRFTQQNPSLKKNKTDSWLEFAVLLRNLNNKLMWKAHMSLITVKITKYVICFSEASI